jgi:glyoxylase-like metal-dependent hydrolase (beta-lactamase superfamily II)
VPGEIVPTPGHSEDSVTLVLDDGAAFTGDLTAPILTPQDPADLSDQSWQRLRAAGARTSYPGHGPPGPIPTGPGWPA